MTKDRAMKRHQKKMDEQLNIFGNAAIRECVKKELPLNSDEATEIIAQRNELWKKWYNAYIKKHGLKYSKPHEEAYERNMISHIKNIYKQPNTKNNEESNRTEPNGE